MPSYDYKCQNCNKLNTYRFASVARFVSCQGTLKCETCESVNVERIFSELDSSIKRDKETIMQNIMEDKARIVEKIRQGDAKTIRNIYGEEK